MTQIANIASIINGTQWTTVQGWAGAQAYVEQNSMGNYADIKSQWDADPKYFNDGNEPCLVIHGFHIMVLGT